jgi:hypothetical protein
MCLRHECVLLLLLPPPLLILPLHPPLPRLWYSLLANLCVSPSSANAHPSSRHTTSEKGKKTNSLCSFLFSFSLSQALIAPCLFKHESLLLFAYTANGREEGTRQQEPTTTTTCREQGKREVKEEQVLFCLQQSGKSLFLKY